MAKRLWLMVTLAAASVAAAGCSGGDGDRSVSDASAPVRTAPRDPLNATPAELAWLRRLGAWQARMAPYGEPRPRPEPLRTCTQSLRRDVGAPPTSRAAVVQRQLRASCESFERVLKTLPTFHAGSLRGSTLARFDRAAALMRDAIDRIPLGESAPLPTGTLDEAHSHVDSALSSAASVFAEEVITVRCWSGGDWDYIDRQMRAYFGQRSPVTSVIGSGKVDVPASLCQDLGALVRDETVADGAGTRAFRAFAEMVESISGYDLPVARCYAVQETYRIGLAIGLEKERGVRLQQAAWDEYRRLPKSSRHPGCRAGGALDLYPQTPKFP